MAKSGGTHKFWGYNPHYGWSKLAHDVVIQLPRNMVTDANTMRTNRPCLMIPSHGWQGVYQLIKNMR